MKLDGKVALITGAANGVEGELMGFGGATARLFAREGAKLILTDINDEPGILTAAQIGEHGAEAEYLHLDVTRENEWAHALEFTISKFGQLDILVNSAGTGAETDVESTTLEIWETQMAVHARGTFLGTKAAIPEMRKMGGGSIINVSSIYGLVGSDTATSYHAAKGAVRLFTKAAAVQYAKEGIRVNSVHPGYAITPLTTGVYDNAVTAAPVLERVPMGRMAVADDIAYGILYLASDEASFVTGTELIIDGGMTAR